MRRALIGLAVGYVEPGGLEGVDLAELDRRVRSLGLEAHVLRTLDRFAGVAGSGAGGDVGGDGVEAGEAGLDDPLLRSWVEEIRERVRGQAVRNESVDGRVREIIRRLDAQEIPVMALGGTALRCSVTEMAGRPHDGVVLMVPRDRLEAAGEVLTSEGLGVEPSHRHQEASANAPVHIRYQGDGLRLELYWKPVDDLPPGLLERTWSASRHVDGWAGVRIPSPGHRVLFGAVRAAHLALDGALRLLGDLALEFPLDDEGEELVLEEARAWPPRMVHGPLWLLAPWGVPGSRVLAAGAGVRWWEAGLTRRVLEGAAIGDGLGFFDHARLVSATRRWLTRSRSMPVALVS